MDLTALLLKLYFNIESAYYEFLDAIDNYVPVYKALVNPIEDNGYPSFPVYCILLGFIVAVLFFFSHAVQPTSSLFLTLQDEDGRSLSGATVLVFAASGDSSLQVAGGVSDFSGRIGFVGIPVKPLRLQVSKDGYVAKSVSLDQFPATGVVVISLEPTSETLLQVRAQSEDRRRVLDDIERLKREGYPEFAEAFETPLLDVVD